MKLLLALAGRFLAALAPALADRIVAWLAEREKRVAEERAALARVKQTLAEARERATAQANPPDAAAPVTTKEMADVHKMLDRLAVRYRSRPRPDRRPR